VVSGKSPKPKLPAPKARARTDAGGVAGARTRAPRPEREPATPEAKDAKKDDVVLIQGVSEDGETLAVLRAREDRVEAGIVRSVKQGEAPLGEVVRLKPRPESPLVCDVEVEIPEHTVNAKGGSDQAPSPHHGPAQVATKTYRDNWDAIWKKSPSKKSLPN
jgi:hypothetical protein